MKFSQWIGIVACLTLVVSCFTNWTWYPDLHKYFTGFVSEGNIYGKPGKLFTGLAFIAIIFFLIPKIWAKRWNVLFCVFIIAYAIKTFILFSGCYQGVCPEKQPGIWVMLFSSIVIFLCALLPDIKLKDGGSSNK
ncbi:MAG: hypothetical protein JNK79_17475 [Chitinophagaceae bacterium]|nr:hypothetical protein [Chitinophagaceae bacterium]